MSAQRRSYKVAIAITMAPVIIPESTTSNIPVSAINNTLETLQSITYQYLQNSKAREQKCLKPHTTTMMWRSRSRSLS